MICVNMKVKHGFYICVCVYACISQHSSEKQNQKHAEYIEIYYKELVHKIMEADKSQDMHPAS